MRLAQIFRPRPARAAGERLYEAVIRQARHPAFYARLGAPDTNEGRFELYSLHVVLLLRRLKGRGAQASDVAQALFDIYISALDHALREMGVGDLSVPKKMRRLGEAFYGRAKAYEAAFSAADSHVELAALLGRTLFAEAPEGDIVALTDYVTRTAESLEAQPLADILAGEPRWPDAVR